MNKKAPQPSPELIATSRAIVKAMDAAVAKAIEEHRLLRQPIAVSENGHVVWLGPDGNEVPPPQ